jgi:hypothetical protein
MNDLASADPTFGMVRGGTVASDRARRLPDSWDSGCNAFVDAECPEPTRSVECGQPGVYESGVIADIM